MIGQTISHYKILAKLGEGGMGVVYKAEDTKLERFVALKFLPAHLNASAADKARFIQEAKAASALNHPNVCTIHDIQEQEMPGADGKTAMQMFMVMEYVDGQTLREKMDPVVSTHATTLPLKQAIDIGIQIADGLAAAHEKGIVHRDIKPENIMVRKDGVVQIMDFGLAKLRASGSKINRLTKEGSTVGTAGYMSPEQVQGQDVDHRSDIFSLGVVLFELFTGQLPFKGVHETALAYEIVNVDPAPMSTIRPDIDSALDAIVLECLEKDPGERAQAARQVSIDLKRFKRESSRTRMSRVTAARPALKQAPAETTGPGSVSLSKRLFWPIMAGIFATAFAATLWLFLHTGRDVHPTTKFAITVPKEQVLNVDRNPGIAISPDGSRIIYKASGKLYVRKLDNQLPEPIAGTEGGGGPFFSPDGRWIAFFADGKLKKVPLNGGAAFSLTDVTANNRGGTWMKDGSIVFSPTGRSGLYRVKEDGGPVEQLTSDDSSRNERSHRWPQAMPDGKTVLFTIGTMDSPDYYEDASIGALNIQTGERKVILKGASTAHYIPDGHLIYSNNGTLFAVSFDPDRLQMKGIAFPVVESVSGYPTTGAMNYAISENGSLVYMPGENSLNNHMLAFMSRNDSISVIPVPPQNYLDPRISPDGQRIAVVTGSEKGLDIWIYDVKRNSMSRLTFGGSNRSPVWSPDGKRVAYSSNVGNRATIVIRPADGSGTPEEIVMPYDRTYVNCWSKDGKLLVVTVPHTGMGWDLSVVPLEGDRTPWMFLSTKLDEAFGALSPDGKWLAYESNETGTNQIYVRPFPHGEGKWQISTDRANGARWSANGKLLYFSTTPGIVAVNVDAKNSLTVGQTQVVFKNYHGMDVESGVSFDLAPDERRIVIIQPKEGDGRPQEIHVVLNWFEEIGKIGDAGK